jgi:hypothetical protein
MRSVQSGSQIPSQPDRLPTGAGRSRLLKNGAAAHAFTREDRARGGRARALKLRNRKALREQLDIAELEGVTATEPELLDQALARLNVLILSEDDRVALRAVKEVLDRTLGRSKQRRDHRRSQGPDMESALADAREKLAVRLARHAARNVTSC